MIKKYITIMILLLGYTASANEQGEIENDPKFQFLAGELALMRKNLPEAVRYYDALSKESSDPFVLGRRIDLFYVEEKGGDALPTAERFVRDNPENIDALVTLAVIYLARDEDQNAINTLDKVASLYEAQKNDENNYIYIYQGLKDKEKEERLVKIFEGLVKLNPHSVSALNLTASLLIDNNRAEDALAYLNQALALDPEDALSYSLIAYAYSDQNKVNDALTLLKKAADEYPSLEMQFEYLKILVADFRYDEALQLAKSINAEYPEDLRVWERLGFLHYALGNYSEAENALDVIIRNRGDSKSLIMSLFDISVEAQSYQEILDIIPLIQDADISRAALINKAHIALKNDNYASFLAIFDELRARLPKYQFYLYVEQMNLLEKHNKPELLLNFVQFFEKVNEPNFILAFYKAMGYYGLNDYQSMERVLRDWLVDHPEDGAALNSLGYMLLETDQAKIDEALQLIEKALQKAPKDSAILDSLGWAYLKKGDLNKAEYYLSRAYNRSKQPEIIAHYIILLEAQKNHQRAKDIYEMFKKIYPQSPDLIKLQKQLNWS